MSKNISEWHKFDLHLHSPKSHDYRGKVKDIDKWVEQIVDEISKENVKMVSITDHQLFSIEVYNKVNKKIEENKLDIFVVPGVEINILPEETWRKNGAEKDWQILVYFNPDSVEKLEQKINELPESKKINEILEHLKDLDCVIVGEGSKANGIFTLSKQNDILTGQADKIIKYYGTLGVLKGFNDSPGGFYTTKTKIIKSLDYKYGNSEFVNFVSTDNHDIEEYSSWAKHISFFKCLPTYTGLKFALTEQSRISTEKNEPINKSTLLSKIQIEDKDVYLSSGLNVVIGPRSSGKTLFLHMIHKIIQKGENSSSTYLEVMKKFKTDIKLYNFNEEEFDKKGSSEFIEQSSMIKNVYDKKEHWAFEEEKKNLSTTEFDEVNKENFSSLKNLNELRLAIKNIFNSAASPLESLEIIYEDNASINEFENKLVKSLRDALESETSIKIEDIKSKANNNKTNLTKLKSEFKEKVEQIKDIELNNEFKKNFGNILIASKYDENKNLILEEIDKMIKKAKHTFESLNNLEFEKYEWFIKQIKSMWETHNDSAPNETLKKNKKIEELKDVYTNYKNLGGKIAKYKHSSINFVDTINEEAIEKNQGNNIKFKFKIFKKFEYDRENSKNQIYAVWKNIIVNTNFASESNFADIIKLSADNNDKGIFNKANNANDAICKFYNSKIIQDLVKDGKSVECSSPGQKAQIQFEIEIDKFYSDTSKSIILLDQPEDSIDNKYVSNVMLCELKKLSRAKQVILVTHNPNLVVNLDPENIIVPTANENGVINYVNGAIESNVSINGNSKSIISIIADYVEGGCKALDDRITKYEIGGIKKNDY